MSQLNRILLFSGFVIVELAIGLFSGGLVSGWLLVGQPGHERQAREFSRNTQMKVTTYSSSASAGLQFVENHDPNSNVNTEPKEAIKRSLHYIRRKGDSWIAEKGCVSCHWVSSMIWSHHEGLKRGFEVDQNWLQSKTDWALVSMLADRKEGGGVDTISQMLLGRDRQSPWRKKPPKHFKSVDPYESLFEYLLTRQSADGSWPPEGQLSTPPELSTGWALLALASRDEKHGDPASGLDPSKDLEDGLAQQLDRIGNQIPVQHERALKYLQQVEPHPTHEGLVLRVLVASVTNDPALHNLQQKLIDAQLPDGGWPNLSESLKSDAYATGLTLYALSQLKVDDDPVVFDKGQQFLIRTQQPDGSWSVSADQIRQGKASESLNEVYSYWGTAWATLALLQSIPVK